jgi:hypothetical protein
VYSPSSTPVPRVGIGYLDDGNQVSVLPTLFGDADLSLGVDFADLVNLARNFNQSNRFWSEGDFNYDGQVNFGDLVALARNFNQTLNPGQLSTLSDAGGGTFLENWNRALSQVPEPGTVATLAGVGLLVLRRERLGNANRQARSGR